MPASIQFLRHTCLACNTPAVANSPPTVRDPVLVDRLVECLRAGTVLDLQSGSISAEIDPCGLRILNASVTEFLDLDSAHITTAVRHVVQAGPRYIRRAVGFPQRMQNYLLTVRRYRPADHRRSESG